MLIFVHLGEFQKKKIKFFFFSYCISRKSRTSKSLVICITCFHKYENIHIRQLEPDS